MCLLAFQHTYHPTVYKLCLEKGLDVETTFTSYEVDVKTLMTIILENNISKIKYLKIDTEGHDVVILKKFYEDIITHKKNNLLPSKILFESNELSDPDAVTNIINLYRNIGYKLVSRGSDTILSL